MKIHAVAISSLIFTVSSTALSQSIPTSTPESVGLSPARLEVLEETIEREIAQDRMPGIVIAITRNGKLAYHEAFGYLDVVERVPMHKDAIFSIASMTKPIFAAAAMALYEEGQLIMNAPVGTYLPELADRSVAIDDGGLRTEPAIRQPTIRDLMLHTSGFVSRGRGSTALHERYPVAGFARALTSHDLLGVLSDLPLRYQPGSVWEYGLGLDILGLAMERVTGQAIEELLAERVFEPLGMSNTFFTIPEEKAANQARVLPINPITGEEQETRDQTKPWLINCGGGCLASTASDYLAFAQMLLNGGTLNGVRVLGPKTVEYMISDHIGSDVDMTRLHQMASMPAYGYGHGLGGAVRRDSGLGGRTGSPGEYMWGGSQGTYFLIDPQEKLAIVFMALTPGEIRGYYRQLIPTLVYQALE